MTSPGTDDVIWWALDCSQSQAETATVQGVMNFLHCLLQGMTFRSGITSGDCSALPPGQEFLRVGEGEELEDEASHLLGLHKCPLLCLWAQARPRLCAGNQPEGRRSHRCHHTFLPLPSLPLPPPPLPLHREWLRS